eukprot:TRINITY_DN11797_c0_g1_i1.p1 TRINITY_DN11797_c0_g1~~TRINITY_DN11797_c0_g1_i1.p1  ORF type:complete len:76 (-),score=10.52 TRINITY_DN11797_c0_g1_i1:218-445(-)
MQQVMRTTLHGHAYMNRGWDKDMRSFIHLLLAKNPANRLGHHGVKKMKEHPFLKDVDFGALREGTVASPFRARSR